MICNICQKHETFKSTEPLCLTCRIQEILKEGEPGVGVVAALHPLIYGTNPCSEITLTEHLGRWEELTVDDVKFLVGCRIKVDY